MPTDPFDKLDAAMDAFERKKEADKKATDAKQAAADQFFAEFSNFRALVAQPVLEEIGNRLKARGHDFRIAMDERESGLKTKTLTITLHVLPAHSTAFTTRNEHPQFTIMGDSLSRKVQFHGVVVYPTGGLMSGGRGDCSLAEATPDFLRSKAVDCIAESLQQRR